VRRKARPRPGSREELRAARAVDRWVQRLLDGVAPRQPLRSTQERRVAAVAARLHASWLRESEPSAQFTEALAAHLAEAAPAPPPGAPRTRRTFAAGVAVGASLAAAAAVAVRLWGLGPGAHGRSAAPPAVSPGRWVTLGDAARFAPGTVLSAMAAGQYVLVVGHAENPTVLSGLCTDLQCPLAFSASAGELLCPCHGARFNLDGGLVPGGYWSHLPALPRLPARVVGGQLQVRL